ncbi:hypothetical protein G9P44_003001 [Scheffersomyces stipitis]|nr:hypothetical protein G9P44_003001 [Scheffersomyces stipitis]
MSGKRVRPAKKLIESSGKCAAEGAAYGQCVLNNYTMMAPNACEQEFLKFKNCVSGSLKGKKW